METARTATMQLNLYLVTAREENNKKTDLIVISKENGLVLGVNILSKKLNSNATHL